MQNPHVKYLKTKNGYFYLFYYEHGTIFCRHYTTDGWTIPQKIAEKASPVFSLCQYEETAHLLYSNGEGQLYLASSQNLSDWEHHAMANSPYHTERTKFFILPTEDTFHIVYHLPTESTGIDSLVYTSFRNGEWEKPYQIDRFMPFGKTPFLARRLNREHIILYYRAGKNVVCAREMLLEPYTMGSVTPLIQTPSPCVDLSIINDDEKIHLLYIVRGMFRSQVVYQYKHTSAISTPRILWEDNTCDNCMAYLEQGKLILMWTVNGHPMRCISENGGASFGAVERYTEKFPTRCTKGELVGAESILNAAEAYGDLQHNYLPTVFLPSPTSTEREIKKQTPPSVPDYTKAYSALQEFHKQKTEELSALLAQRSDEISTINAQWKAKTKKLEEEILSLRTENECLKNSIKSKPSADYSEFL